MKLKCSNTFGCILSAAAFLALPFTARASKDMISDEALVAMMVILVFFLALVVSNFVLSLVNINKKKPGIRIYNCVATAILLVLTIPVLQLSLLTGLVVLAGIFIQGWLIYLGFPSKKRQQEQYDL
jgi:hypothetical protein